MKRLVFIISCFCFFCSQAHAEPTIHAADITLQVSATPLQCYRTFTDAKQIRHWQGAIEAGFLAEPGGPWRVKYPDGSIEEGLCVSLTPGEQLVYTLLHNDESDTITVDFQWKQSGSELQIHHRTLDRGDHPNRISQVEAYWSDKIERLRLYLNETPGCYFAFPVASGRSPAVILLHDRLGINRTIRAFADSLAASGFIAVAVDMFKGEVTADLNQAEVYLELVKDEESLQSVMRVVEHLRNRDDVQKNRIAVWGLGYGGSIAFSLIAQDSKMRACVSWYGNKLPPTELHNRLSCPVLAIFGDQDITHPRADIEAFDQALVNAGVRVETVIVAGGHTFADPAYGTEYNDLTTRDALKRTLLFLDKRLKL